MESLLAQGFLSNVQNNKKKDYWWLSFPKIMITFSRFVITLSVFGCSKFIVSMGQRISQNS